MRFGLHVAFIGTVVRASREVADTSPPIIASDSSVLTFFVEAGSGHDAAPADDPEQTWWRW